MKQTNERLCALAQKGDATALDSLIDNNKSFIGKVANDLFRSMNLAQAGLNLDTDDLKQAGNLGLWKAVPKFDAARGMKFMTYAAPAIRNAMMATPTRLRPSCSPLCPAKRHRRKQNNGIRDFPSGTAERLEQ